MSIRLKLIQKIIKAQDATPPSDGQGELPDAPALTAQSTVPGAPPTFNLDSYFPTFGQAWGTNFKAPVNQLLSTINWSIFILSNGQISLDQLRQLSFNVDASKYPDTFLAGMVMFAKLVFNYLLNAGRPFTTKVNNKKEIIDYLIQQIGSNTKIPDSLTAKFPQSYLQSKVGNPKSTIISILTNINSLV